MQKQDFLIFFSNIFFLEVGFEQVKLDLGYFALKAVKRKHTKGCVTNVPHFLLPLRLILLYFFCFLDM